MRQTKLDGHLDGDEENKVDSKNSQQQDNADTDTSRPKSEGANEEVDTGSKRKADDEGPAAAAEPEPKAARQNNNGPNDLAVDAAAFTSEQRTADKELRGTGVEDSKAAAQNEDAESSISWEITEKGLVYFYYRPKVQAADKAESTSIKSIDDLQNTFMLLVPRVSDSETAPATKEQDGQQDKREPPNPTGYRLISLGKKRLPEPDAALKVGQEPGGLGGSQSEAIWACVAEIGTDIERVAQGMAENRYSTRTRGDRITPAARPAGRGHYILSIKKTDPPSSREVRLTYHLSHPSSNDFGEVQEDIGLHPSSSIIMQMRNPTLSPTGPNAPIAGLPADQRAKLSKEELKETFGGDVEGKGTRYARPEEPALLDRQGVELLLIKKRDQENHGLQGAGDDQAQGSYKALLMFFSAVTDSLVRSTALQSLAEKDSERLSDQDILNELKLSAESTEVKALSGDWI